ncbi:MULTISPECIES: methionine ABC transporter permease [Collinsella]|uniref:methionine ABC transporter permease n=1 Tax=Collinsella TaxID=102106 RepID=UPI000B398CA9|nr:MULTISPECIES: methionine ABC transporter permease [Collinsella]MBM6907503.1 ABC transporter permease [Collinsella intestinalis]MDM8163558.1 methionine ABC transporter permease [Collinsella intestinalis]OUO64366.1 metal ABC transporter permease [Collinsella sp. An268]
MLDTVGAFIAEYGELLLEGTGSTIVMVLVPTAISYIIGLALGVVLYLTAPGSLRPLPVLNAVLGWVVNILRSFPFIVLMVFIIPFTRLIMGTGSGILGTIPPLVLSASPFIARMIEQSLAEVPRESVEAVEACGASVPRIVFSALLPEALPSIVRGVAVVLISVLGYTAIAGAVGAGGLGDIAIRYGYYRYQSDVMLAAVIILVVLVQIIQSACDILARKVDHRSARS